MMRHRESAIAAMVVAFVFALCLGLAGCHGQSASKQAAAAEEAMLVEGV